MEIYSAAQMIIAAVVAGAAGGIAGAWVVIRGVAIAVVVAGKKPKAAISSALIRNWCAACGMPQPSSPEIEQLIKALASATKESP